MIVGFMTLNLRFGLAADGENAWDRRKESLAGIVCRHAVDFLAVQEANAFQAAFLGQALQGWGMIGVREPAPRFWQNNVIFYAPGWGLESFRHFYLSPTPDTPSRFMESRWPRQCSLGVFSREGKTVAVAGTHFDFAESVQVRSARLVLKRLAEHRCPAVLMGDFNARPEGACYGELTGAACGLPEAAFKDVFDPGEPDFSAGTHHGFTGVPNPEKGRIDWILYRGFRRLVEKEVIRDKAHGRYPSDHFPVKALFEI